MDFARILTRNFCQLFELQFDYVCFLQICKQLVHSQNVLVYLVLSDAIALG